MTKKEQQTNIRSSWDGFFFLIIAYIMKTDKSYNLADFF